ncbi:hypothetical protein ON010_g2266 [Phytophthora cinnamomi]|nr:hypothetical protein ON010_g2266 [Phytophthora cinnamomi]
MEQDQRFLGNEEFKLAVASLFVRAAPRAALRRDLRRRGARPPRRLWRRDQDAARSARPQGCAGGVWDLLTPGCWRREASGFRLLLLRQLVKAECGRESMEGDSEKEKLSGRVAESSYVQAILDEIRSVGDMLQSVFTGSRGGEDYSTAAAPFSVQYEALGFLSDFVQRFCSLENGETPQFVELSEQVMMLMNDVFVVMHYASQPTFVTCAVLEVIGNFLAFMEHWKDITRSEDDVMVSIIYKQCLESCLMWLVQSSCTFTAMQLLDSNEPSNVSSQEVFIGKSTRFPFLQQWLVLLSRIGVAFVESSTDAKTTQAQPSSRFGNPPAWAKEMQLPSRRQLFAVLAEQDDVMIEVLNGLTRMAALTGATESISKPVFGRLTWAQHSMAYLTAEYDPDLLFADLVDTLGRDHLVLLDLLVSNETHMLEYFMRYLRQLAAHWETSKKKLQMNKQLENVMSVLIRLRLEIDKLVVADLFPYGAGPLTRRLLSIERLYEEPDDDAERL